MKRAILLVGHGSRLAEANAQLETLGDAVRGRLSNEIVEVAHMEIAEPTIAQGIQRCVEAGARQVVVCPYFLAPGRHTRESIPALVDAAARDHRDIEIRIAEPLGLHTSLLDSVLEWLGETG